MCDQRLSLRPWAETQPDRLRKFPLSYIAIYFFTENRIFIETLVSHVTRNLVGGVARPPTM